MDAIYCSTHGGRRANSGIGALDMLSGIVDAAGDVPVMFDSGVGSGDHIVKATVGASRCSVLSEVRDLPVNHPARSQSWQPGSGSEGLAWRVGRRDLTRSPESA